MNLGILETAYFVTRIRLGGAPNHSGEGLQKDAFLGEKDAFLGYNGFEWTERLFV